MYGLTSDELRILHPLRTPEKIQDFLDTIPSNFENRGETYMSPRRVLRERIAHCMEGAMLAALALRLAGHKPLVMDLKVTDDDDDHVVTLFKDGGYWGAISKTNHGNVRYRDPIYRSLRELVMSYFNEYTEPGGRKIMRSYSRPVDLSQFDSRGWVTSEEDVRYIPEHIDQVKHYAIVTPSQIKKLRRADNVERVIGVMVEWENKKSGPPQRFEQFR